MHSLNKECLSCVPEPGEDTQDMEGSITFYEIEETDESAFSPIPVRHRSTLVTVGILRPPHHNDNHISIHTSAP